jgi:hypothetical protein
MVEVYVEWVQSIGDAFAGIAPRGAMLRCRYDVAVVTAIKDGLRRARAAGVRQPGCWLPGLRGWFVFWVAWPYVRAALRAEGCPLVAGVPPARPVTPD